MQHTQDIPALHVGRAHQAAELCKVLLQAVLRVVQERGVCSYPTHHGGVIVRFHELCSRERSNSRSRTTDGTHRAMKIDFSYYLR
jgi:hypothetical protein